MEDQQSHPDGLMNLVGRPRIAALAVAAALFVVFSGYAGMMANSYFSDRAAVKKKIDIAKTAAGAITTLWTYSPESVDSLTERAADYLGGDFEDQYRKFMKSVVVPAKQAQVTNKTEVVGVAVESVDGSDASAMVFANNTATSPLTHNIPSLKYVSYLLKLESRGSKWRVTGLSTIGSMDLTPKL